MIGSLPTIRIIGMGQADRTLDRFDDVAQADLLWRSSQHVPASRTTPAHDQLGLSQTLKDLLQKSVWNSVPFANGLHTHGSTRTVVGEIKNSTKGVLCLPGEMHGDRKDA